MKEEGEEEEGEGEEAIKEDEERVACAVSDGHYLWPCPPLPLWFLQSTATHILPAWVPVPGTPPNPNPNRSIQAPSRAASTVTFAHVLLSMMCSNDNYYFEDEHAGREGGRD